MMADKKLKIRHFKISVQYSVYFELHTGNKSGIIKFLRHSGSDASLCRKSTSSNFSIMQISALLLSVASLVVLFSGTARAQSDSSAVNTKTVVQTGKHSWLRSHARFTGGQITLPFKIREDRERRTFKLTTDVTLGGYLGCTVQLNDGKCSVTVPATAGLTFINAGNNTTTVDRSPDAEVIPGLTWSTGLVVQLEQYSLGLMVGKDYASEIGDEWAYHGKLWWSFGIGFVFLQ